MPLKLLMDRPEKSSTRPIATHGHRYFLHFEIFWLQSADGMQNAESAAHSDPDLRTFNTKCHSSFKWSVLPPMFFSGVLSFLSVPSV